MDEIYSYLNRSTTHKRHMVVEKNQGQVALENEKWTRGNWIHECKGDMWHKRAS
jgi:hypothetical protein